MIFLFTFVIIALFPAAALWAWRSGSASRVYWLTTAALLFYVALSLFSASSWGGNRLVDTQGFWPTAWRVLFFYGLVTGLPILTTAVVVLNLSDRIRRPAVMYGITAGSAFLTFVVGTFLALFAFFS